MINIDNADMKIGIHVTWHLSLVYHLIMEGEDVAERFVPGFLSAHDKHQNEEHLHEVLSNANTYSTSTCSQWEIFGRIVPKDEVIFICQVLILYIVIIACIVNLSLLNGDSNLWTALLSSSLGIMLPPPTLSRRRR